MGKRTQSWLLAAALVLGGGVGTWFSAVAVTANTSAHSREDLRTTSTDVASSLQLALERENDLVVSAGAFIAGNPGASNTEFIRWARSVRALDRYPELTEIGHAVLVPAAELPTFAARAAADPTSPLPTPGTFEVIPPGPRPFYCFSAAKLSRPAADALPAGLDFCSADAWRATLLSIRDSGQPTYASVPGGGAPRMSVMTPIYRGGVVPTTVDERRAASLGWVGNFVAPGMLLDRALTDRGDVAVTFSYRNATSKVDLHAGNAPRGAHTASVDLHNGWTVRTTAKVISSELWHNPDGRMVLLGGLALSILLAGFLAAMAASRGRALGLTHDLRHQALHDALTGLPNRALIVDRTEQLLARNRRAGTHGAVLYVDLDEFKNVNDTLGHDAGDRLLLAAAARMRSALREADTIGRMGGDEFVVLLDGAALEVAPELVAERLLDVMRRPFELDGAASPMIVTTSIGIAVGDRASAGDMLRDADVALYEAKATGKDHYAVFHREMRAELSRRVELEFELRAALDAEQFRLVYQPIYNLDDLTLIGVEALLRWEHPTRGLVMPDEFIPVLEQTGHIREVGRWVLREACRQTAVWHARGDAIDVSVNVSGAQLDGDDIVEHIREALAASGLDATSLIIEMTETALMRNADATARRLQAIKALGVRIAIDDFGTGYSSLAYLQQFSVDSLKIDRTFVNAIQTSNESKSLIQTLVHLGNQLGITTLAEGVETTEQMDYLREAHVNEAQGYLLSRPLEADELELRLLAPARPAHQKR